MSKSPGAMVFTLIPTAARSRARGRVIPDTHKKQTFLKKKIDVRKKSEYFGESEESDQGFCDMKCQDVLFFGGGGGAFCLSGSADTLSLKNW